MDGNTLKGIAAAPGQAEGTVAVVVGGQGLDAVQPGQVLVTDNVNPATAATVKTTAAVVTDGGGKTSHAAIFAREAGIPAVVGTGTGTTDLANGAKVRVNGDTGEVTVLG